MQRHTGYLFIFHSKVRTAAGELEAYLCMAAFAADPRMISFHALTVSLVPKPRLPLGGLGATQTLIHISDSFLTQVSN